MRNRHRFLHQTPYDLPYKRIHDGVYAAITTNLAGDDTFLFQNCQMLRDHRLRLIQAAPEIGDTGVLILCYTTQQAQTHWVTTYFELLCAGINERFRATVGILLRVSRNIHTYSILGLLGKINI